jgi:SAM-dependent methyltransferase
MRCDVMTTVKQMAGETGPATAAAKCGLYLPGGAGKHRFYVMKTALAYRVWRRKLRRYAGWRRASRFSLLDVGCGSGYLLRCLERWFPASHTYGLDAEPRHLDFAAGHLRRTQLVSGTAERLPFDREALDVVCVLHVLEHLAHPEACLAEAWRVLRTGGLLLAATPNPAGIAARILKGRWPGRRADHISLRPPPQWRQAVDRAGLQILEDGTTGLSGFRLFRRMPFAPLNWLPLMVLGYFPWEHGESYMLVARKN